MPPITLTYSIADVAPYINWIYFYHAWGISNRPAEEKSSLRSEAEERLRRYASRYHTHALFRLLAANGDGDDIVLYGDKGDVDAPFFRLPMLRQQRQGSDFLCLSDFVRPLTSGQHDSVGVFATSADIGLETDFDEDPYEKMMMQLLADRLAEATAERMHQEVRMHYWGYAPDEQLSIADLLQERWQGIRPAVGYPSLPDTSLNFLLDQLLDMGKIGIRLTESGAMKPHASVSGLMISHPRGRYFTVGRIGPDQLADYARRRSMPMELARRFLASVL